MLKKLEFRNIDVKPILFEKGVNLIVGDKKNSKFATNNSVGKTLLIEAIDHLLGAQRKDVFNYTDLEMVSVVGTFIFQEKEIIIERYLLPYNKQEENNICIIKNDFIEINNGNEGAIPVKDWLTFLQGIYVPNKFMSFRSYNRMFFRKEDVEIFKKAIKEDSSNGNWARGRYNSYFLDLGYEIVATNKHYSKQEKSVLRTISPTLQKVIGREKTENNLDKVQSEYTDICLKLRNLYDQNRTYRSKIKILNSNIEDINDISSEDFIDRFNVYKYELKELIVNNYLETKKFHEQLINDNKDMMLQEIKKLQKEIFRNEQLIDELKLDQSVLQNKIKDYDDQNALQEATRELLAVYLGDESIGNIVKEADSILKDETTDKLKASLNSKASKIENYKIFLQKYVKQLYPTVENVNFNIYINNDGVFDIDFDFRGVRGEGMGTIRTLLYILLLIDINQGENIDYLIMDSKVIDSVDVDILDKFFEILDMYSKQKNVQIICAGNKQNFKEKDKFYNSVILTPDSPLFGIELMEVQKDS